MKHFKSGADLAKEMGIKRNRRQRRALRVNFALLVRSNSYTSASANKRS
jgi:hypothetical protein